MATWTTQLPCSPHGSPLFALSFDPLVDDMSSEDTEKIANLEAAKVVAHWQNLVAEQKGFEKASAIKFLLAFLKSRKATSKKAAAWGKQPPSVDTTDSEVSDVDASEEHSASEDVEFIFNSKPFGIVIQQKELQVVLERVKNPTLKDQGINPGCEIIAVDSMTINDGPRYFNSQTILTYLTTARFPISMKFRGVMTSKVTVKAPEALHAPEVEASEEPTASDVTEFIFKTKPLGIAMRQGGTRVEIARVKNPMLEDRGINPGCEIIAVDSMTVNDGPRYFNTRMVMRYLTTATLPISMKFRGAVTSFDAVPEVAVNASEEHNISEVDASEHNTSEVDASEHNASDVNASEEHNTSEVDASEEGNLSEFSAVTGASEESNDSEDHNDPIEASPLSPILEESDAESIASDSFQLAASMPITQRLSIKEKVKGFVSMGLMTNRTLPRTPGVEPTTLGPGSYKVKNFYKRNKPYSSFGLKKSFSTREGTFSSVQYRSAQKSTLHRTRSLY